MEGDISSREKERKRVGRIHGRESVYHPRADRCAPNNRSGSKPAP